MVSSSLMAVKPFPDPPEQGPSFEVEEFVPSVGDCSNPYVSYVNHLFVYPKNLKYDSQKSFTKVSVPEKPEIRLTEIIPQGTCTRKT